MILSVAKVGEFRRGFAVELSARVGWLFSAMVFSTTNQPQPERDSPLSSRSEVEGSAVLATTKPTSTEDGQGENVPRSMLLSQHPHFSASVCHPEFIHLPCLHTKISDTLPEVTDLFPASSVSRDIDSK